MSVVKWRMRAWNFAALASLVASGRMVMAAAELNATTPQHVESKLTPAAPYLNTKGSKPTATSGLDVTGGFAVDDRFEQVKDAIAKTSSSATNSPLDPGGAQAARLGDHEAREGTALRVPISVLVGASRSMVYVNGRPKGKTPYLGDIACKAGEKLKIDVMPPKGLPLTYRKICAPGSIRIVRPPGR